MTGRDAVSAALRLIGALASGEAAAASDATDGLSALNRMLGTWSNEGLLIYSRVRDQLTLVASTAAYTMGTGGTFSTARPQAILEALIRDETVSPAAEYPIRMLTLAEYAAIAIKAVTSTYPTAVYDDGGFPYRTLTLYPVPSATHKLVIFSQKPLTEIATLDTSVSLPVGYDEAIIYNLALRLAPEYGKQPSDLVVMIAGDSLANVKRANQTPRYMRIDDLPVSGGGSSFNIYTGGSS